MSRGGGGAVGERPRVRRLSEAWVERERQQALMPAPSGRRGGRWRWAAGALALVAVVAGLWLVGLWRGVERFSDSEGDEAFAAVAPRDEAASPVLRPSASPVLGARADTSRSWDEAAEVLELDAAVLAQVVFNAANGDGPPPPPPLEVEPGRLRTYLVFSTGTNGISDAAARGIGVTDPELRGADTLTDVLILVLVDPVGNRTAMISIPRDTWVTDRGERVNAIYPVGGSAALGSAVADLTGVPVDHLIRVNMMGFVQITDLLGGVPIWSRAVARDQATGLELDEGSNWLDGAQALAFVRSRSLERLVDGQWVLDGSADFGRMQRQQQFVSALVERAVSLDVIPKLPELLSTVQGNVVLDDELGLAELVELARRLAGAGAELPGYRLPVASGWVGRRSVLFADPWEVRAVVEQVLTEMGVPHTPTADG